MKSDAHTAALIAKLEAEGKKVVTDKTEAAGLIQARVKNVFKIYSHCLVETVVGNLPRMEGLVAKYLKNRSEFMLETYDADVNYDAKDKKGEKKNKPTLTPVSMSAEDQHMLRFKRVLL